MKKIKEVIVVEGRYDKNTLSQVVDATVVTLGGFAVFNDREKLSFLRRLAPVSYTHLDVYKRQFQGNSRGILCLACPGASRDHPEREAPVSYTHLDVYKRQV